MLVTKMREAAREKSFECEVTAYPVSEVEVKAKDADVILLGPQVRYELKRIKGMFPDKPVDAISPTDYGMLKGDNVLQTAMGLMGV